jgi:hypothetical protein
MRSLGISFAIALATLAAAPTPAGAETQTVIAVSAMSEELRVAYDQTGEAIVTHIESAQKAMASSTDFAAAQRETGQALTLLRGLNQESPTQRYHDAVARLLHKHRAKKATPPDFVPVVGALDEVKTLQGIEVADTHTKLERVKGKLEKEPTVDASADLIDASDDIGYLEIDLPIQATKERLMRAHLAIAQRDAPNANAALADALSHAKTWTAKLDVEGVEADAMN